MGERVTIVLSASLGRMLWRARGDDSLICKSEMHDMVGEGVTIVLSASLGCMPWERKG